MSKSPQACNFIKKEAPTQVFFCELCEILRNIFFIKHLRRQLLEVSMKGRSFIVICVWFQRKLYCPRKLEKRPRLNLFSVNQQVSAKSKITSKDTSNRILCFFCWVCFQRNMRKVNSKAKHWSRKNK